MKQQNEKVARHRSVRIGARSVRFSYTGAREGREHHVQAIWDPAPPSRWKPAQLAKYRAVRDSFMAELDEAIGCRPIVVDKLDLEGAKTLCAAAEVMLAAKAAGVTCSVSANAVLFHGDPDLVAAWQPALRAHQAAIMGLLGGRDERCHP